MRGYEPYHVMFNPFKRIGGYDISKNLFSDDDLPGAHLLAEAKFSLQKIFPQMQKKFHHHSCRYYHCRGTHPHNHQENPNLLEL